MATRCAIWGAARAAITYWQPFFPTCYGPEFASRLLDQWAYLNKVELDFSRLGKPTDNAFIEALKSRLRQECLNASTFLSMADARQRITEWRIYYNEERPHFGARKLDAERQMRPNCNQPGRSDEARTQRRGEVPLARKAYFREVEVPLVFLDTCLIQFSAV